ncbi:MAG: signal peptidase II [Polyangiaceae bacterium]
MSDSTPPAEPELGAPPTSAPPTTASEEGDSFRPSVPPGRRPRFLFFGVVAAITLILDIGSKAWAEIALTSRPATDPAILVVRDHLTLTLAYNKGGAWGLLQDSSEFVRLPFFLAVSVLAVLFIVSLYGKLGESQNALRWGLPLVLGGALGNLSDRITRSSVIDFIDYRADWVLSMNHAIAKLAKGWALTDHWPTFNVADIAICIGVGLMAVDMFTSRRGHPHAPTPSAALSSQPPAG